MHKAKSPDGWSLNEGLAAQYAAQAGLDPDLAAPAGEAAWDVLKSLRDTVDEPDPARRARRVQRTRQRLAMAGLDRHRELVRAIQERLVSLSAGDNTRPSVNPDTGLQEFFAQGVKHPMHGRLERKIGSLLDNQIPNPSLPSSILTPLPQHTPEFVSERFLHNQGTRDDMADRVSNYADDLVRSRRRGGLFSSVNPDDLPVNELGAAMRAVEKKLNPTDANLAMNLDNPQDISGYYAMLGLDQEAALQAPIERDPAFSGFERHVPKAFRRGDDDVSPEQLNRWMATTNSSSDYHFVDHTGQLRRKSPNTLTDDPLYFAYDKLRRLHSDALAAKPGVERIRRAPEAIWDVR